MINRLFVGILCLIIMVSGCSVNRDKKYVSGNHSFNGPYTGEYLNRVAFPMGGIGAGMVCLDGNGSFSSVSLRNNPDFDNSPMVFAALMVKGYENSARILEGPVPSWKIIRDPWTTAQEPYFFGCPRYETASFSARFPFGTVQLNDPNVPVDVSITGWSPFIPGDEDNSSLPVAGLEYTFSNQTGKELDAVFSFHSENLMRIIETPSEWGGNYVGGHSITALDKGFIMDQSCIDSKHHYKGSFSLFTDDDNAVVDYCWFRGGWWDDQTIMWKDISSGNTPSNPVSEGATGASVYVPVNLKAKESKTVRIMMAWYVPHSNVRAGSGPNDKPLDKIAAKNICKPDETCPTEITSEYYEPWYSGKFKDVADVAGYWRSGYDELKQKTGIFTDAFYSSDLPPEVLEAISANLGILKSPTVLRQKDGRFWAWEGCHAGSGSCYGSCTHVWNYAQAVPHLFPRLERSLRETEFLVSQSPEGHQTFRTNLPIRRADHGWYAAADGQLGGIMKMHREWKISGDTEWLRKMWPAVRQSLNYCIEHWDPRHTGTLEEPHHNTYDIEFWGSDAMCTGFYLGALTAAVEMAGEVGDDDGLYKELLAKGKEKMETDLFDGEYFIQKTKWEGLNVASPVELAKNSIGISYSPEALKILEAEGPKYQYGTGCLSDGVLGLWIARMCGIENEIVDNQKVESHLLSIHKYNLKNDLSNHANPQRTFAYGKEGGLLLCTWPKGGQPTLPFVYSNEVWTGIEYQVASHLMLAGHVNKGLDIVKACRQRYDGRTRNPFDEIECGHWYARALASYGLIQGLTGLRYDATDKTLYIDSKIGIDFKCFISTETGFGMAGLKRGRPFIDVRYGTIDVEKVLVSGKNMELARLP